MELQANSDQSISKILEKSIKKITESEGYTACDFTIKPVNSGGANFLGQLFEVDITGETTDGFKEVNIFVKVRKDFDDMIILSPTVLYRTEAFFYTELSGIINILQDEAQIPAADRFKIAKSYGETCPDAIFLENLTTKGFEIYHRMDVLPLKCLELAIKEIAKFHGISFVIEKKMPEFHDNKVKVLQNPFDCDTIVCASFVKSNFAYVADICDETTKTKVEKFMSVFFEKFSKYKEDKTSTVCALSHGDFKSTNILVRQHDGEPEELVIVDYQFIDYGCPLRDLFLILTANTDQVIRRNHMSDLKELYYDTLSRYLKYFNMDVEAVYPRIEFDRVFSEWFSYGLMLIFFYLPILFAPDTGKDYASENFSDVVLILDENTKDRIRKLLQDFIDWGYL